MKVSLNYGKRKLNLDIPEENFAGLIEPTEAEATEEITGELKSALENPHGPPLDELAENNSVCVLVEDHTRDEPHKELLTVVAPFLSDAKSVTFIVATGSHEVEHPENLKIVDLMDTAAKKAGIQDYTVSIHDCQEDPMIAVGETSRRTPVVINAKAANHDLYVALADMKAHYFAGYSNALKDFLPGICAFESVEANHAMAVNPKSTFGRHPYHPNPERRDNPLADDMREAYEMIADGAEAFTLSIISSSDGLVWAEAGELEPVIRNGIEVLDKTTSFTVKPADRIIVSPGGYPQDKSLYHAQRGLELTKNAVRDGGEVLFLAECRDGVAPEKAMDNFYNKLTAPLDEVVKSISSDYHLYEHKAYKFAELLQQVRIHMFTELTDKQVQSAHLEKSNNPQDVIDEWLEQDPDCKIMALNKGNKLAVYKD